MSKKAAPNKTFRLSALAFAIMAINAAPAHAAQCVAETTGEDAGSVLLSDGESCENSETLSTSSGDAVNVFMEGANTALVNEATGTLSATADVTEDEGPFDDGSSYKDAYASGVEGGGGALTITNKGAIEVSNTVDETATGFFPAGSTVPDFDSGEDAAVGINIVNGELCDADDICAIAPTTGVTIVNEKGITVSNTNGVSPDGEAAGILLLPDELETEFGDTGTPTISDVSITNTTDGMISVTGGEAVGIGAIADGPGTKVSGVTITNAGTISVMHGAGGESAGIIVEGDDGGVAEGTEISNSGVIGAQLGIGVEDSNGTTRISNSGTINSGAIGIEYVADNATQGVDITNSGAINSVLDDAGNCIDDGFETECWANGIYVEGGLNNTVMNEGDVTVTNSVTDVEDFASGIDVVAGEQFSAIGPEPVDLINATIDNSGNVTVSNATGEAIGILLAPDFEGASVDGGTINNSGTVTASGEVAAGISVFGEQSTSGVSISNTGTVTATGTETSWGIGIEDLKAAEGGTPTATVVNSGDIAGATGISIDDELDGTQTTPDSYVTIDNQAGGMITGTEVGIAVGVIDDFGAGPVTIGAGKVDINNDGTIDGGDLGTGISIVGDSAVMITNTSTTTIKGNIGIESASTSMGLSEPDSADGGFGLILENVATGTISGTEAAIKNSMGNISVTNFGMIDGDVMLMGDNSILVMEGGTVTGDVTLGGAEADLDLVSGTIDGNVIGDPANGGTELLFIDGPGEITGDVTDVGSIDFLGGTHTIGGTIATAGFLEVFGNAIANLNGATVTVGGVENGGNIQLAGVLNAGSYVGETQDDPEEGLVGSTGTIYFMIESPTAAGQLVAGAVDLKSSTALGATPAAGLELAEGAEFHVVDVTTAGGLSSSTPVEELAVQGGGLYVFRAVRGDSTELVAGNGDNDDVFFIADRLALTSIVSGGEGGTTTSTSVVAAAAALEEVLASGTTDPILTEFVNEVLPLLDTEEIVTVLEELSQTSTVGSVGGAASAAAGGSGAAGGGAGAVGGTDVAMRLDELRFADSMVAESGVNSGDHAMAERGFWIQAGNSKGEQDERDGVAGYDSISESLTLGLDAEVSSGNTAGLAYTYVRSDVSPDGNPGSIDMDTHALTLYGSTKRGIQSIDASFTYSDHAFDSSRGSAVLTGRAVADYDGSTLSLNLGTSWDNKLNKMFSLEPKIGLTWSQTEIDKYSETTTGGTIVPMTVEVDDIDALVARAGIALKAKFKDGPVTWAPRVYAIVHHDFEGEKPSAAVSFIGSTPFPSEGADPEKTLYEAGVGVTAYQTGKLKLTGKYGYSTQDDFEGQSLSFTARWKF